MIFIGINIDHVWVEERTISAGECVKAKLGWMQKLRDRYHRTGLIVYFFSFFREKNLKLLDLDDHEREHKHK